jgi:hypothetical protein
MFKTSSFSVMCSQKLSVNLCMFLLGLIRQAKSINTRFCIRGLLLFTHIIYNLISQIRNVRCKCLYSFQNAREKPLRVLLLPTALYLQTTALYAQTCPATIKPRELTTASPINLSKTIHNIKIRHRHRHVFSSRFFISLIKTELIRQDSISGTTPLSHHSIKILPQTPV